MTGKRSPFYEPLKAETQNFRLERKENFDSVNKAFNDHCERA